MRLAIVGSRYYNDYSDFKKHVETWKNKNKELKIDLIVSGGAKGADHLAEMYARDNNIQIKVFQAEWKRYGRGAAQREIP